MPWCPLQVLVIMDTYNLPITDALIAEYAGQNCWSVPDAGFESGIPCGQSGPEHGRCTLPRGHDGVTHIAHCYGRNHPHYDLDTIYVAWIAINDEDLIVDVGL